MDQLLQTDICLSESEFPLYVYEDTNYKGSISGQNHSGVSFVIPIEETYCIMVSLNSIKNEVIDSYRQNSVISPQDCTICKEKFQFSHSCIGYKIHESDLKETFPTNNNSSGTSNRTIPSRNMSSAISRSTWSQHPLIHALFDTREALVCRDCMSELFSELESVRTDPDLVARSL